MTDQQFKGFLMMLRQVVEDKEKEEVLHYIDVMIEDIEEIDEE